MVRARNKTALSMMLLISGCAPQPTTVSGFAVLGSDGLLPDVSTCVSRLSRFDKAVGDNLNADDITIINWNIQKGADPAWVGDLQRIHHAPDLLILQEASPTLDAWQTLTPDHFHSFAAGHRSNGSPSGVMTVSAVQPITECNLVTHEPWLGTRKATLVTEYELTDTDETLLVVNIHGVNFSLGVRELEQQFRHAQAVIVAHKGPVLFSGDFNTWRGRRVSVLEDVVTSLGLSPVQYDDDHRKRFMGWPLDHIYVRGLDAVNATTRELHSSDHNPMLVRFQLMPDPHQTRDIQ